ncbi:MAG: redoxin domain-containing protein [Bacteroidetes bacterium]|nr:redoxin domain-containing protein [Bacteroidota bacterium]
MNKIIAILFFICVEMVSAQNAFEKNYSSIQLTTPDQKIFSLNEIKKNTASVFVFLLPDCPSCQSYSLTLNQLCDQFKPSGIQFYGVFPGHYNTSEEMNEFQSRYHIRFLLMTDPEKKLVKSLGAKVSPEVFVVDNHGKILYRGRIDDWMYGIGKKKISVNTHEFQDALNAIVHHQPIKVPETKAIGCIIE